MTKANTRPEKKGRAGVFIVKAVLVISGILILLMLALSLIRMFCNSLLEISPISAGELKKVYNTEGILVWDETAVAAPASGELKALVRPGERVRAGEGIAAVKTSMDAAGKASTTALVRSTRTGVVIFHTDGLEGLLNSGKNDILEVVDRQDKENKNYNSFNNKTIICEKGKPVLKIIDNLSPLTVYLIKPEGFFSDLSKKNSSIFLEWNKNIFPGWITEIREYGDRSVLVVQSSSYPSGLLDEKRKVPLVLPGETVSGYLVNEKSLVEKNGVKGIYIMAKQWVRWIPVKIEGVVDGKAAVSNSQIVPGTVYVANPRWLLFIKD